MVCHEYHRRGEWYVISITGEVNGMLYVSQVR